MKTTYLKQANPFGKHLSRFGKNLVVILLLSSLVCSPIFSLTEEETSVLSSILLPLKQDWQNMSSSITNLENLQMSFETDLKKAVSFSTALDSRALILEEKSTELDSRMTSLESKSKGLELTLTTFGGVYKTLLSLPEKAETLQKNYEGNQKALESELTGLKASLKSMEREMTFQKILLSTSVVVILGILGKQAYDTYFK
jgi:chromosome segregation ATPase